MAENPEFDLAGFLPYLLNRAAEESSAEFAQIYKDRYGLLRTEWRVLFHLGQHGEMTATEIGAVSKIHKTKISRAVAGLQKRRYLRRDRSPSDRRREALTLTAAGETVFRALSEIASDYNRSLLDPFSDAERAVLMGCLMRLSKP
jgi:DNA-binding MarR family transcriptional regulator